MVYYDTARIRSGFKTGNLFIFLIVFSILAMHKCFPCHEGCKGIDEGIVRVLLMSTFLLNVPQPNF